MEEMRAFNPLWVPIAFMSGTLVAIILCIVTTNYLWAPIAFMRWTLFALALCIAAVDCLWQLTTSSPKFRLIPGEILKKLKLRIVKDKLLQRRPQITRRNSTTSQTSISSFPSNERRRSQITRRQSTTDLPSKALWSKSQYKPASFMGIPPEIRLMIYDHVFPSKIGAMRWTCDQSISYYLEPHERCEHNVQDARYFKSPLLEVHPKIYREAKELLWNRTVFGLGCTDHANSSLRCMSWISRRLIKRIQIPVEFDRDFRIRLTNISKSILTMNAMARDGLLESITILVLPVQLQCIMDEKLNGTFQFDLLRSFGNARTWSCKRSMIITDYESYEELLNPLFGPKVNSIFHGKIIQRYRELFEELHQAWGGTLYLGNTLIWENGRHVYRAPPSPVTPRKPF